MTPAQKIFSELPGEWALSRTIHNFGKITGSVTFTPQDDGRLLYQERGQLYQTATQAVSDVTRSYIYELRDDTLVIYYNDPTRQGEILHELSFAEEEKAFVSHHCHLCVQDTYDLTFRFGADRHIEMDYVVKGPEKSYAMQSRLEPRP